MNNCPIDPNGMVMDLARSCYTGFIQCVEGDPTSVVQARWYFAAKSALPFPVPHAFGSPIWDDPPLTPSLGWLTRPTRRNWDAGRRRNTSDGTKPAGPVQYFQLGAPGPGLLARGINGTPLECLTFPVGLAAGGLSVPGKAVGGGGRLGGTARTPATPGTPCMNCIGSTPALPNVTVSGASGPVAFLNGTWGTTQNPFTPCQWASGTMPVGGFVTVQRIGGNTWVVSIGDFLGNTAFYQVVTADCMTPFVANQTSGGPDFPPTVSVAFS